MSSKSTNNNSAFYCEQYFWSDHAVLDDSLPVMELNCLEKPSESECMIVRSNYHFKALVSSSHQLRCMNHCQDCLPNNFRMAFRHLLYSSSLRAGNFVLIKLSQRWVDRTIEQRYSISGSPSRSGSHSDLEAQLLAKRIDFEKYHGDCIWESAQVSSSGAHHWVDYSLL